MPPRPRETYASPVIVLRFPDGSRRELEDEDARRLASVLWDLTGGGAATVAAGIEYEVRRSLLVRQPVDVPERRVARVSEALALL
jgi:hypothetical protein